MCIIQFATNDENVNLGDVSRKGSRKHSLSQLMDCHMSISYTRHSKASEKYHEVKLRVCVLGVVVHDGPSGPRTKMNKATTSIVSGTNINTKRG